MRNKLLSIAQSLRLPAICILCNQFHNYSLAVCHECIALMPRLGISCSRCAFPLSDNKYAWCGHCIKKTPHFDSVTIGYRFEDPLRSLVHRFKYQNELYLGAFLTQLILNTWQKQPTYPQCLIPVPMHPQKIKTRGFNQTVIFARLLSKKLGIPYDIRYCKKIINTPAQVQLDRVQRTHNLRGAFSSQPSPFEHVALIDDLLTTGSTANELANNLKLSGVQQVELWCCARTVKK